MDIKFKTRLKKIHKEFHRDNDDLVNAIKTIENFGLKYRILASDSIQDHLELKRNKKKVMIVILMQIALSLYLFKYLLKNSRKPYPSQYLYN